MLKIGNLKIAYHAMPAPLASITDIAFRKLWDEIGYAGFMVTEMISAEGLRRGHAKTLGMIRLSDFKTPQFIQLFSSEPGPFVEAIQYIENETGFSGVDINMGCPAYKVIKKGAGAALLKNPRQVAAIMREIKKNTRLPVTVKIRLGFTRVNVIEIIKILEKEGADAVAVHFRLCTDRYSREARWHYAPLIKETIKNTLLFGNGDIKTAADAKEKLKIVDGVMIGRGAVMNPLIFAEIAGAKPGDLNMKWVYQRLLELVEEHYTPGFRLSRIKAYTRFLWSSREHSKKKRRQVYTSTTYEEAKQHFASSISPQPF
ncbi:MAG: tRNA-dihydrouridine synthase family protein [Candidatus Aminicenantes bacterium]|nr:MAG: tRNA-dihydrouridine synthase family protein [Candidatus Aminicenantes bacterium]